MGTYILKYSRGDEVKYISHLDFVRFIGRVVRRADIPFLYSQGFNPHPLLTVALPLSVGVTAEGELMKIGFDCDMPGEEIKKRLNDALPPGFKIEKAQKTEGKEFDLSRIDRAEYIVRCEMSRECDADIDAFLALDEIKVMKKSKSGIKEADIKPHIHRLSVTEKNGKMMSLEMTVDAGNIYNLKPDTVIGAMEKYIPGFKTEFFAVHRRALLAGNEEIF